jgi:hypothetical protein
LPARLLNSSIFRLNGRPLREIAIFTEESSARWSGSTPKSHSINRLSTNPRAILRQVSAPGLFLKRAPPAPICHRTTRRGIQSDALRYAKKDPPTNIRKKTDMRMTRGTAALSALPRRRVPFCAIIQAKATIFRVGIATATLRSPADREESLRRGSLSPVLRL